MDQDKTVYIVVDRVGAPYQVLLYQPSIRFSLGTNTKVSSLQQTYAGLMSYTWSFRVGCTVISMDHE